MKKIIAWCLVFFLLVVGQVMAEDSSTTEPTDGTNIIKVVGYEHSLDWLKDNFTGGLYLFKVIDNSNNPITSGISVKSESGNIYGPWSDPNGLYRSDLTGKVTVLHNNIESEPFDIPPPRITAGGSHTVVLRQNGTVWGWGANWHGQLGDGTQIDRITPVQVNNITNIIGISAGGSHTVALKDNGTVWSWGRNFYGQLGDGSSQNKRLTPIQAIGLANITKIVAYDDRTVALKSDGTVWVWGYTNEKNSSGNIIETFITTPVQVVALSGVTSIAAGRGHTVALKNDGTVWAWGPNDLGVIGDGTNIYRTTPVQVIIDDDNNALTNVVAIAAGQNHTVALKSDGTVWTWGYNSSGQLGNGTTTGIINKPVQVNGLSNISAIAAYDNSTAVIKTDKNDNNYDRGTVWTWGENTYGQLGNGTTVNSSLPVKVTDLFDVSAIAVNAYFKIALKHDGTIWAWGENTYGQLGNGTTVNSSLPVKASFPEIPIQQEMGALSVTLSPQDAITAGAQWRVDAGVWQNSGVTVSGLNVGTHTVDFKDVTGWTKPSSQSVTIKSGETATLTGTYIYSPSTFFVTRNLPNFYMPGTKLTVTLTATPASGVSSYAVEDSPPAGWTVSNINEGGFFDSTTNKVKFGPFFDNTAKTLTYEVTPPAAEIDKVSFSGTASSDGTSSTIGGKSDISSSLNHPADNNPIDFSISQDEVTAYGAAWKKGTAWTTPPNPIPSDYITRAGYLWKNGERYDYSPSAGAAPLCWVKYTPKSSQRSNDFADSYVRSMDERNTDVRSATLSTAICAMVTTYSPSTLFTVTITVTPSTDVFSYAVEDVPPQGWAVGIISSSGIFDAANNKVKYGPFFDNTIRTLTYQITPPATATGDYTFAGTASFDGVSIPITGVRAVSSEIQESIFKVLTDSSPYTVLSGYNAKVYGFSAGQNKVTLQIGASAKLINFPGNNVITIQSELSLFKVFRSGATVTFEDSNGTVLTIPATKTRQTIKFNDVTLTLIIENNQVMLENQLEKQEVTLETKQIF